MKYLADEQLRQWMERAGISTFSQLQALTHLSRRGIDTLRQGRAETLRYTDLYRTSQVLHISLDQLLRVCGQLPVTTPLAGEAETRENTIRAAIQVLEPWLLQWPRVLHALQQQPNLPAQNLLPLLRPIDQLLSSWQIFPIGTIGEVIPCDLRWHQPLTGEISPGTAVVIRYPGYRRADCLLYRAKVEMVKNAENPGID